MRLHSSLLLLALSGFAAAEPPEPPTIRLNSVFQPNQTEVVSTAGSVVHSSCHGNGSVHMSTTSIRQSVNLEGVKVKSKDTGTYDCRYTNQSSSHSYTWIHSFVKGDPSSVFVTPSFVSPPKEDEDFSLRCSSTDPSVTNLTLQSADRGKASPPGMKVTLDPRRGALIKHSKRSFSGRYTCSGWRDGREFLSQTLDSRVAARGVRHPPSSSVSPEESVRSEGERFSVTCQARNPSHRFYVEWKRPHLITQGATIDQTRSYDGQNLYINVTSTIPAVNRSDSGSYTCRAVNDAGVATATSHSAVLDKPYSRVYSSHQTADTSSVSDELPGNFSHGPEERTEEPAATVSIHPEGESVFNSSTGDGYSSCRTVEMHEGGDLTLIFIMEAYPPIREHHWTMPDHLNNEGNSVYERSYTAKGYRSEARLSSRRSRQEDRGRYSFSFSNLFCNGTQDVDSRIFRSPTVNIIQQNHSSMCSSSGYPLPTLLWSICSDVDMCEQQVSPPVVPSEEGEEVRIFFPSSTYDDITVRCLASNSVGAAHEVFVHRSTELPTFFTPALIGASSVSCILFLLSSVVVYKCRQKPKYEISWKIIESNDGNNYTFVDPTQLPYNEKWEFPREKSRSGAVSGSGAFGKVVEATAFGSGAENKATRVAVKMSKPSAHSEEREASMSESKILSHLGYHDNIVNSSGACTQGGPMSMITEYCSHGDLLNFLRAHARDYMAAMITIDEAGDEVFYKNMTAQQERSRSDSGISCWSEYQEMQPVSSPGQSDPGEHTSSSSLCDSMRFSYQVAQGLDFSSSRNCIHRDVAARNVSSTDCRVAKICDFGLARDIQNDDSYIVQGNARSPVKWMAPESIFQCLYTVQSDVWSYGVSLWEIFSSGKSPYPNVVVDTNFYMMIKDGRHMEQPEFAPNEMYHSMKLCWSLEPTHRPTFKTIGQLINRLMPLANDTSPRHTDQVMYENIDECRPEEEEEEEEVRARTSKRNEEDQDLHHDCEDGEEKEPMMNIYQLS